MSEPFDATPYVRPPVVDIATAIGLSCQLLSNIPKKASAPVLAAARKLRKATVHAQTVWGAAIEVDASSAKRPADIIVDNAWGALEQRIAGYARLPANEYPLAAKAQEIHDALFANMNFLTLEYTAEWAEGEARLTKIDKEGLAANIDKIAGPDFLSHLRVAHAAYGKVLGATTAQHKKPAPRVVDALNDLKRGIVQLAINIIAGIDEDVPTTVATAQSMLEPLDQLRAAQSRKASGDAPKPPAATPTTPVPEVPAAH